MSNHLLIAGTGRAGTSFLVRYLARLGLNTKLSQIDADEEREWHQRANAGFEDIPLPLTEGRALPYVIKSPWTYQYIQELLGNPALQLDAVIIPIRDLAEAAASRSIIELEDIHETLPWMRELAQSWEDFGHTPGGLIYSLNPLDQARLLAVGFHTLVDRLVKADIPIILLAFPRFIEDPEYLFRKLSPVLAETITAEFAETAHSETADAAKVRTGAELRHPAAVEGLQTSGPGVAHLDRAALARLLAETHLNLAAAETELAAQTAARDSANQHLAAAEARLAETGEAIATLSQQLGDASAESQTRLDIIETIQNSPTWRAAQHLHRTANRMPWLRGLFRPLFRKKT